MKRFELIVESLVNEGKSTHLMLGAPARKGVKVRRVVNEAQFRFARAENGKSLIIHRAVDLSTMKLALVADEPPVETPVEPPVEPPVETPVETPVEPPVEETTTEAKPRGRRKKSSTENAAAESAADEEKAAE